jgi:hypothetical protein
LNKLIEPGKLVQISPTLFATVGAYYNKRYRNATREHLPQYVKVIDALNELLELKDHRFVLKPIPNFWNGVTIPTNRIAFVDPRRQTFAEIVATTCHEALHLKQLQDGFLRWDDKTKNLVWMGIPYETGDVPDPAQKDYDTYKKLPWEADVESREKSVFQHICKATKLPYKTIPKHYIKTKYEK